MRLSAPHRPTRDLDLLGFGDAAPDAMLAVFTGIAQVAADDGLTFDVAFAGSPVKREQWTAFVRDVAVRAPPLEVVCADLRAFLAPNVVAELRR